MFCKKCGSKLPEDANFCPMCGQAVFETERAAVKNQKKSNNFGIAALVFSLPPIGIFCGFGIVGFILALLGLNFAKKNQGEGHGISFAALLVSSIWLALIGLAMVIIFLSALTTQASTCMSLI